MTNKELKQSMKRVSDLDFEEAVTILAFQVKANCVVIGRLQSGEFVFRMNDLKSSRLEYKSLDVIKEELLK